MGETWVLVVLEDLREEILDACRNEPIAGHLVYCRTLARVQERHFWLSFPRTVRNYVGSVAGNVNDGRRRLQGQLGCFTQLSLLQNHFSKLERIY